MKSFFLLLVFTAVLSFNVFAQSTEIKIDNTLPVKFDPSRNPAADLEIATALAAESGKRILLDVGGEWCIWCHRLDTLFMVNSDLDEYLKDNYVVVKVNVSKENKNESFLSNYPKVAGYPHLFVLDKKGKLLHSQNTGDLESGKGHDKDKVFAFLKKWSGIKQN